jgi:amino acid transporter
MSPSLERHFGLLQATALNITTVVGAGVFVTIPLMLDKLPGPYALLGWLLGGLLIVADGLVWSELAAAFPGSGGSYLYLLECYGRQRWGRLMAFLFIWQFLISGPLEIASGLIALAQFSNGLGPEFRDFNKSWQFQLAPWGGVELPAFLDPSRILAFLVGVVILFLLYRRITILGRLTVTFWLGVLAVIAWILIEGLLHSDLSRAFDLSGGAEYRPRDFGTKLGAAMRLAIYSYLGYYTVCYIGDEVRHPARTIPRSILFSVLVVCVLFVGLHLAMLGTVRWQSVPTQEAELETYSLPATFMEQIHGKQPAPLVPAATLVTLLLMWSCFGSAFTGLLGYSRIPYGAARYGHFFSGLGRVHPVHRIPHVSLLVVGGLTLFWSFFSLQDVIEALIMTRILEQFVGQTAGLLLLRRLHPEKARPYKMVLYPLPCFVTLVGWLYLYVTAEWKFIAISLATLFFGGAAFLIWARHTGGWPFTPPVDSTRGNGGSNAGG